MKLTLAVSSILFLLVSATIVYHYTEKWSWIDSFYFTGTTLTTVGYGDIHPVTDFGKLFTVIVAFISITIVFYSVSIIASTYFQKQQEVVAKRLSVIEKRRAKEHQKNSILDSLEGKGR